MLQRVNSSQQSLIIFGRVQTGAYPMKYFPRSSFLVAASVAFGAFAHAQSTPRPDALLSMDLNRNDVVEKIALTWAKEISPSQMGGLKAKLTSLRADQLLAASLSGSFDSVLEIVHSSPVGENFTSPTIGSAQSYFAAQSALKIADLPAAQKSIVFDKISQNLNLDSKKALGDSNADLVYTPLVPCRLFDTRAGLSSALGTVGGTFRNQQTKTISPSGACGIPTSGVASLFLSFHSYNNNPSALGVIGFMAPGTNFSALAATWTGVNWATGTFITRTNPDGSFDAFVGNSQAMTADMIVDVMGYFRSPGSAANASVLVNGGHGLRIESASTIEGVFPNVINGYSGNAVARECPGGETCVPNTSQVSGGTIAGGVNNKVTDRGGTVGGGLFNRAGNANWATSDSDYATVAGGYLNVASGADSTVSGGSNNLASGAYSAIPGGNRNEASGTNSFAVGRNANANTASCAVIGLWSTTTRADCLGLSNVMRVGADRGMSIEFGSQRADGGGTQWVYAGDFFAGRLISASNGAYLSLGGSWQPASDRARKENISKINPNAVLRKVISLPVTAWNYIAEGKDVKRLGPMAQDFYAAFGLGGDDKTIGVTDASGVALAAIQGLNQKLVLEGKAKDAKIAALERSNESIRREFAAIKKKLGL
jgi:hypothetical protein